MTDEHPTPAPTHEFTRQARSDYTQPPIYWLVAIGLLISAAIIFVGYRVYQLETDRQSLNQREAYINSVEKDLAKKEDNILEAQRVRAELLRLEDQRSSLQRQIDSEQRKLANTTHVLTRSKSQLDSATDTYRDLQKRRVTIAQEIQTLTHKETDLAFTLKSLTTQLTSARARVTDLQSTVTSLESEIDTAGNHRRTLLAEIGTLDARKKTLETVTAEQQVISTIATELQDLVAILNTESRKTTTNAESLQQAATTFRSTSDDVIGNLVTLVRQTSIKLDEQVVNLQNSNTSLNRTASELDEYDEQLGKAITQLETINTRVASDLSTASIDMKNILTSFNDETDILLATFSNNLDSHVQKINDELTKFAAVGMKLADASVLITGSSTQVTNASLSLDDSFRKTISELTQTVNAISEQTALFRSTTKTVIASTQVDFQNTTSRLETEIVNLETARANLDGAVTPINQSATHLLAATADIEAIIETIPAQLEKIKDRILNLETELPEAGSLASTLDGILNELAAVESKSVRGSETIERLLSDIELSANKFRKSLVTTQESLEDSSGRLSTLVISLTTRRAIPETIMDNK